MTDPEEEKSSQTTAVVETGDSKPEKHGKKKKKKKTKRKEKLPKMESEDSVGDADASVEVETAEEASRVVKNESAVDDDGDETAKPKKEKKSKKKNKKQKKEKRIKQEPSGSKGETKGDETMGDSSKEDGNGVDNDEDGENDSDDELLAAAAMWAGDDDNSDDDADKEEEESPKDEPPSNFRSSSSFSKRITTTPTQPQNLSLHITQLPYDSTEFDLRKLFAEQGCSITSIRLVYDHDTDGRKTVFRGVAFCDFLEASSYHKALKLHHKASIRGRRLNIRPCKSKEELAAIVERTQNLVREKIHQQLAGDNSSVNTKNTKNTTNPRSSGEGNKPVSKANRTGVKRTNNSSPKDRKTKKPRVDKDGKPIKLTKKERNRRAAIIMQKRRRQKK